MNKKDKEDIIRSLENLHLDTKKQEKPVIDDDPVNSPSHYSWLKELCGIEPLDIARHLDFNLGNVIKYVLRAGHKVPKGANKLQKTIEDLQKANVYLLDEIKMLQSYEKNEI